MSKLNFTDVFVEGNDLELDLNLLDTSEEDTNLGLSIEFNIGDSLDLNLNDLPDDLGLELIPMSDCDIGILKSIMQDNIKYDSVEEIIKDDVTTKKRAYINSILSLIKDSEANSKLLAGNVQTFKGEVMSYIDNCLACVNACSQPDCELTDVLMLLNVEFDSDTICKDINRSFKEFLNDLKITSDEINKSNLVNNAGSVYSIELDSLNDYHLDYIKHLKFVGEDNKIVVTCPSCGKEYTHKIIESTRCVKDVIKGGIYLKHNPLICDECTTVSILDDDSIRTCKEHIINFIPTVEDIDMLKIVPSIDVDMLSKLDIADIDYPEEKPTITKTNVIDFVNRQKLHKSSYNTNFYKKYLKSPKHYQEKVDLYNYNGLAQLGILDRQEMEKYLIGGVLKTGYFDILRELYAKKQHLTVRLCELAKVINFIDVVRSKVSLAENNSDAVKKVELELGYGLKVLEQSLENLNIKVKGVKTFTISRSTVIFNKVYPVLEECKAMCESDLNLIESQVDSTVEFLSTRRGDLFRFVELSPGNKMDYYKLFNSKEQGVNLLKSLSEVLVRYIWDKRILKSFSAMFKQNTHLKNNVEDSPKKVSDSINKILKTVDKVKYTQDYNAFIMPEYINEMPREFLALSTSIDSRDFIKFIYDCLVLRTITPPVGKLATELFNQVLSTNIDANLVNIFNNLDGDKSFMKFKEATEDYLLKSGKATSLAMLGDSLSLFEHKELVCKINMYKYINTFLLSKDNISLSRKFVEGCVKYVDRVYNLTSNDCSFIKFMYYFEDDCALVRTDDLEEIELDCYIGEQLLANLESNVSIYSRRLSESLDSEVSQTVSLDRYDKFKVLYMELPENFKYIKQVLVYMLNDFGNTNSDFEKVLSLVDSKYVHLLTLYLSCLSNVKISDILLKDLSINREVLSCYNNKFNELIEHIKSEMGSRTALEFSMCLDRILC